MIFGAVLFTSAVWADNSFPGMVVKAVDQAGVARKDGRCTTHDHNLIESIDIPQNIRAAAGGKFKIEFKAKFKEAIRNPELNADVWGKIGWIPYSHLKNMPTNNNDLCADFTVHMDSKLFSGKRYGDVNFSGIQCPTPPEEEIIFTAEVDIDMGGGKAWVGMVVTGIAPNKTEKQDLICLAFEIEGGPVSCKDIFKGNCPLVGENTCDLEDCRHNPLRPVPAPETSVTERGSCLGQSEETGEKCILTASTEDCSDDDLTAVEEENSEWKPLCGIECDSQSGFDLWGFFALLDCPGLGNDQCGQERLYGFLPWIKCAPKESPQCESDDDCKKFLNECPKSESESKSCKCVEQENIEEETVSKKCILDLDEAEIITEERVESATSSTDSGNGATTPGSLNLLVMSFLLSILF